MKRLILVVISLVVAAVAGWKHKYGNDFVTYSIGERFERGETPFQRFCKQKFPQTLLRWLLDTQRDHRVEVFSSPLAACSPLGVQNPEPRWFVELCAVWHRRHGCRSTCHARLNIHNPHWIRLFRSLTSCTSTQSRAAMKYSSLARKKFEASWRSTIKHRRTFTTYRDCFPLTTHLAPTITTTIDLEQNHTRVNYRKLYDFQFLEFPKFYQFPPFDVKVAPPLVRLRSLGRRRRGRTKRKVSPLV